MYSVGKFIQSYWVNILFLDMFYEENEKNIYTCLINIWIGHVKGK